MSSVQRQYAQKLTKQWSANDGIYYYTYAEMKAVFDAYSPRYTGTSSVLFKTESDLANAVADLDDYAENNGNATTSTYPRTVLNDIGKDVHLGVQGGDSSMYTYRLFEFVNNASGNPVAGLLVYALVEQNPSVNVTNIVENVDTSYGLVWVSRGY